jgi:2-phosphosulfolactate phosphatase
VQTRTVDVVHVHLVPALVAPEELRGATAVVIDVIRATTTIVHALAAGAEAVVPCETVEEARRQAAEYPAGTCLLGGERGGARIEGFDLGNSPAEYTPNRCRGKTVVFTTTNGTRALLHAGQAERVLVGALVNRRAICRTLLADGSPVHLVCAGRLGQVALEDVLGAGAIVEGLSERYVPGNDAAMLARDVFRANAAQLSETLHETRSAEQLRGLGAEADIEDTALLDRFDLVPEFDAVSGRIVVGKL